jgi:hypothetical protein
MDQRAAQATTEESLFARADLALIAKQNNSCVLAFNPQGCMACLPGYSGSNGELNAETFNQSQPQPMAQVKTDSLRP